MKIDKDIIINGTIQHQDGGNPKEVFTTDGNRLLVAEGWKQDRVSQYIGDTKHGDIQVRNDLLDDYSNITSLTSFNNYLCQMDDLSWRFVVREYTTPDWNGDWLEKAEGVHIEAQLSNGYLTTQGANYERLWFRVEQVETVIPNGGESSYVVYTVSSSNNIDSKVSFPMTIDWFTFIAIRNRLRVTPSDYSTVLKVTSQTFTDAEKTQARANILAEKRSQVRIISTNPTNQNFIDWEGDIFLVKTARSFVMPASGVLANGSRYLVKTDASGTVAFSAADGTVTIEYNDVAALGNMTSRSEAWILFQDNVYYITGEVS